MSSMKVTKIELNSSGIVELMKSQDVISCLQGYANDVASRSGGEVQNAYIGKTRANVSVMADNTDNALLKSL